MAQKKNLSWRQRPRNVISQWPICVKFGRNTCIDVVINPFGKELLFQWVSCNEPTNKLISFNVIMITQSYSHDDHSVG